MEAPLNSLLLLYITTIAGKRSESQSFGANGSIFVIWHE